MNPTPLPTLLVPTTMFNPSNISLQDSAIVKAIPMSSGSILLEPTAKVTEIGKSESMSGISVFGQSVTPAVKVSNKGRRPKSLAMDMKGAFDLGIGMFTDRPMCRSCGKYFMSRQQLNQHMLVHTDVRKYKCTFCDRTFKQPSHLHQHHRIHTGEKPYKCPMLGCSRAFPQQSNLNHHLRNHDKPAPPPENTCSLCMRTYASETVLRSHIAKIHMCDPDSLLGARKKIHTKDITVSKPGDSVSEFFSQQDQAVLKRKKTSETNSDDLRPSNKFTNSENTCSLNDTFLVQSTAPGFCTQDIGYMQKEYMNAVSTTTGTHNSQTNVTSGDRIANGNRNDCERFVQDRNGNSSQTLNNPDQSLFQYFVAKTTNRRQKDETENAQSAFTNGSSGNATGNNITSGHESFQYSLTQDIQQEDQDLDAQASDEQIPSYTSRSRKRKAFQPQRVVQKLDINEEHEYEQF